MLYILWIDELIKLENILLSNNIKQLQAIRDDTI